MRLDKYLWATRYYKTRSLATEACKKGHIKIANSNAKPSKEVFIGDHILVRKNQINYELNVLDVPSSRVGAKLVDLYRKDITPQEALDNLKLIQSTRTYYREKGTGRPTKKDRRNLEDYTDDEK